MNFTNNIIIKKIWQDNDCFEASFSCSADNISATTNVYSTQESIEILCNGIRNFCNSEITTFKWLSGDIGDDTTASVSLLFLREDGAGHITIEVFMEIDDGAPFSIHNCCFYVQTELGLLLSFLEKLERYGEGSLVESKAGDGLREP